MPLTAKLIRRTVAIASRSISGHYNLPCKNTAGIAISRATMSSSSSSSSSSQHNQSTSSPPPLTSPSNLTPHSSDSTGATISPQPLLPAPDSASAAQETDDAATTTVQVNGAPVILDKLGPMVVGRDGTLSRIANWHEMSEFERENTLRILGKRNQLRLKNLRQGLDAADEKKDE
ncbi:hypothetical protein QBC42DRAFT_272651 [Cladorrhinum samala]|uniref:Fungal specific transcription factor n=1 Tax=Cladorrhinum samala TaxID=585594 RepID=A0AAV9HLQ3_9PEZI|nr:hypothetical protein QBC42DRAFT_272651 [Cladorrhinum samala]